MKFINWLEKWLPFAWGVMWIILITGLTLGATIWVVQWVLSLLGGM